MASSYVEVFTYIIEPDTTKLYLKDWYSEDGQCIDTVVCT